MIYRRALISVYDKTGLEGFLKPLVKQGLEIVSTGGTASFLKSKGFEIEEVKGLTHFPELLSGRVKTLHPHIFVPLLARDWENEDQKTLKDHKIKAFDLLVVNLYPFEEKALNKTEKETVEWIDIGGPSLLRAGAKNYFRVMTVCDISDYHKVKKNNNLQLRREMAVKVFDRLSSYNDSIAQTLKISSPYQPSSSSQSNPSFPRKRESPPNDKDSSQQNSNDFSLTGRFFKKLRYGENPHQTASWHQNSPKGLHQAQILQGKALSYNNILDFETGLQALKDFTEPCAVAIKHNNPCGAAVSETLSSALEKALKADPLSVFGGVIALNKKVNKEDIDLLSPIFLEGLIAPDFSDEALSALKKKSNLRVLKWPEMLSDKAEDSSQSIRNITGGFLIQSQDTVEKEFNKNWKIFGEIPDEEIKKDLLFAWKVSAHLKSNAIAVVKKGQTLGLGMGQVNRVSAVKIALNRIKEFHPKQTKNLILASDAFFPFPDSIEWAKKGGVRWIIQPGGSIKDQEVLKKAEELKVNVVLTGKRHFKH